ncbi:MAG: type II secretion system protein J [Pirellulaceae bacterium]
MRTARSRKRNGWSLIELVVVYPLMAMLVSGSAILLTVVFRSQQSLSNNSQQQASHARLAVDLRNDAHAAMSVQCESPLTCDFTVEGAESVHYEIKDRTLQRELRKREAVLMRENFPLQGLTAQFSIERSPQSTLVRLHLKSTPEPRKYSVVARSSLLEAAVGIRPARNGKEESKP